MVNSIRREYNNGMEKHVIPSSLQHYFWGDDLIKLNLKDHETYIVQTLLENGDTNALKWLFSVVNKQKIHHVLSSLRLSKKSSNFWQIYLS